MGVVEALWSSLRYNLIALHAGILSMPCMHEYLIKENLNERIVGRRSIQNLFLNALLHERQAGAQQVSTTSTWTKSRGSVLMGAKNFRHKSRHPLYIQRCDIFASFLQHSDFCF